MGLREHNGAAWSRLVRLFGPVIYQWCRSRGLRSGDAEDVVQKVFLNVATHLDSFHRSRTGQSFRAWIWTIANNAIRDQLRRDQGYPNPVGGTDAHRRMLQVVAEDSCDGDDSAEPDADCLLVHRLLELIRDDFEEGTWAAFWAMVVEDKTAGEIAVELNKSPEAVRQAKCRVMRRLREEWQSLQ